MTRLSEKLSSKILLVTLGALLSFTIWVSQCWVTSSMGSTLSQEEAIMNLEVRVVRLETLLPEMKATLDEIKTDVKHLTRVTR